MRGRRWDPSNLFRRIRRALRCAERGPSAPGNVKGLRASPLRVPVLLSVGKNPDSVKKLLLYSFSEPNSIPGHGSLTASLDTKNRSAENFGSLHRRHPRKCCSREERGSEVGSQCRSNICQRRVVDDDICGRVTQVP